VLTTLAILGAIVLIATQGLIPGLVWAVVLGVVVSISELFTRVDKVAAAPSQAPAQGAIPQEGGYKRCATCDQLYSAEYDGCPFCARRGVPPTS
jgi:hypothetical protein